MLSELASKGIFMAYLTVGFPTPNKTIFYARLLHEWGADILELGLPTFKPKYDGPIIKKSYMQALKFSPTLEEALSIIKKVKVKNKIMLTYFDNVFNVKFNDFFKKAFETDVKAILFPDLLIDFPKFLKAYVKACKEYGLELVFFIPSNFPHRLINELISFKPAFIYLGLMMSTGIALPINAVKTIKTISKLTKEIPIIVGFAIKEPKQVESYIKAGAKGIVIGSAILEIILDSNSEKETLIKLKDFMLKIKQSLLKSLDQHC